MNRFLDGLAWWNRNLLGQGILHGIFCPIAVYFGWRAETPHKALFFGFLAASYFDACVMKLTQHFQMRLAVIKAIKRARGQQV